MPERSMCTYISMIDWNVRNVHWHFINAPYIYTILVRIWFEIFFVSNFYFSLCQVPLFKGLTRGLPRSFNLFLLLHGQASLCVSAPWIFLSGGPTLTRERINVPIRWRLGNIKKTYLGDHWPIGIQTYLNATPTPHSNIRLQTLAAADLCRGVAEK